MLLCQCAHVTMIKTFIFSYYLLCISQFLCYYSVLYPNIILSGFLYMLWVFVLLLLLLYAELNHIIVILTIIE